MAFLRRAEEGLLTGRSRSPPATARRLTWRTCVFSGIAILLFLGLFNQRGHVKGAAQKVGKVSGLTWNSDPAPSRPNLHILIPTNKPEVNLCKTLLGLSILGYPTPTLVAWNEEFNEDGILGGGSHKAKVFRVLDYLKDFGPTQDDDLVLMIDAYDLQFQVPLLTLLDRYENVTQQAHERLTTTIGKEAVLQNNMTQSVLFGAGKRCAPNHPHEIPCWAVPESPLPDDLYGSNTDTVIGHNTAWSTRQRYLNSGFIMGSARSVRYLFEKAAEFIHTAPDLDPLDPGDHMGDFGYHGSDQSIFMKIWGRQEWMRESLRLKHSPEGTKPRSSQIYSTVIDNVLSPSFAHEDTADLQADLAAGRNKWEYGIHLDYWSDFTHQTINSEVDGHFLGFRHVNESIQEDMLPRTVWDCPLRLPHEIPVDMRDAHLPAPVADLAPASWLDRRLYTHVCLSRFPAAIHFNGIKSDRELFWPRVWYQSQARAMLKAMQEEMAAQEVRTPTLQEHKEAPGRDNIGGAWTDKGQLMSWEALCPMDGGDWERELFRDVK